MFRKSLIIITLTSSIFASNTIENTNNISKNDSNSKENNNSQSEKYKIYADNLNSKENLITAVGNVVIFSKSYYMTANKIIYDKKNETFELFDKVVILKDNNLHTSSNYTFIDMKSNNSDQNPTLMLNKESLLWVNSTKSSKTDKIIDLQNAVLSSCDCNDPDWTIKFSSATYNSENKWLQTYNNRLMIGEVPVFYMPYWAFSMDKTRRSGLLMPTLSLSNKEGFSYSQPIFIAPAKNYDIELIPQFRKKRGKGIYSYLRYADSPFSTLYFNTGYFKENNDYFEENNAYFEENNAYNKEHYGFSLNYKRSKLFTKKPSRQDGLFVDIEWINDVEFKELEDDSRRESYTKKIESKINYFYNTPEHYTGIYFTHYLDTSIDSNSTTMQKLPQAQFHTYAKPMIIDKLLYSTDTIYTNYSREEGITANQLDVTVPFSYTFFLLNDYLRVSLKNTTSISHLKYSNATKSFDDGTYIENNSVITLGSDLTKPYKNFIHTINFNLDFTFPNAVVEDGDLYINSATSDNELNFFPITKTKKTADFSINHSLYDRDDLFQIINHKIKQSIIYNEFSTKLSNLENEVSINHILGSLTNRLLYSQIDNKLIESSTGLKFKYNGYFFNVTHYASKDTPNSDKQDDESYILETGFSFLEDYTLKYNENYNIQKNLLTKRVLSLDINDRCWDLNIKLEKELISSSPEYQDIIFFTIEFKELGGYTFNEKINEKD